MSPLFSDDSLDRRRQERCPYAVEQRRPDRTASRAVRGGGEKALDSMG